MKKFDIKFVNDAQKKVCKKSCCKEGVIICDDYYETFVSPLEDWGVRDYKEQWREGMERIKDHDVSCLITAVTGLGIKPKVNYYVLYKIDSTVYFQPQFLGPDIVKRKLPPFDKDSCCLYIPSRVTHDESGEKYDEWSLPLKTVLNFLD